MSLLPGHRALSPAESFARMAGWCEEHQVQHDTYGEGELVQGFEKKVAALLGLEAGLFCITGTLTQVTALRLACEERGSSLVALHASSHILVHERSNYQLLQTFPGPANWQSTSPMDKEGLAGPARKNRRSPV